MWWQKHTNVFKMHLTTWLFLRHNYCTCSQEFQCVVPYNTCILTSPMEGYLFIIAPLEIPIKLNTYLYMFWSVRTHQPQEFPIRSVGGV